MGYTVYIDSHGDPQGNFTLLATRRDTDQRGLAMHPVGSFLLDHNDTKLPVSRPTSQSRDIISVVAEFFPKAQQSRSKFDEAAVLAAEMETGRVDRAPLTGRVGSDVR